MNPLKAGDKVRIATNIPVTKTLYDNIAIRGYNKDSIFTVESTNHTWVRLVGIRDGYDFNVFVLVNEKMLPDDLFHI